MRRRALIIAPIIAMAAACPEALAQHTASTTEENTARYVSRNNGRTIDATFAGDRLTVLVDGVRIPDDRLKRENNFITILDERGAEIGRFYVMTSPTSTYIGRSAPAAGLTAAPYPARATPSNRLILGVVLDSVSEALAAQLGLHPEQAAIIRSVVEGGAAANAGVEPFDILVGIEDEKAGNSAAIRAVLDTRKPGDRVRLHVVRKGEPKTITLTLTPPPRGEAAVPTAPPAPPAGAGEGGRAAGLALIERERERAESEQRRVQVLQERLANIQSRHRAQGEEHADAARRLREEVVERLRSVEGEAMAHARLSIDAEARAAIEDAMRRATEALKDVEINLELPQIEILRERANPFVFMPTPRTPETPAFPRAAITDDRFQRLEQRMDRLEALLEQLVTRLEAQER